MEKTITKQEKNYINKFNTIIRKRIKPNTQIYLLLLLPMAYLIVFKYVPMLGIQIAFKDFSIKKGIWGSSWIGLTYFKQFFNSPSFWMIVKNTLGISLYSIVAGFPAPIILALMLNEVSSKVYRKTIQMITYAPYFISTVIMVSLIIQFLNLRVGLINNIITLFGCQEINFMGEPEYFKTIYVLTDIWQYTGYGAIIYLAALSGVDPMLYDSAVIDGASRLKKIWYIDIPSIAPTIIVLLILRFGHVMSVGFEKVLLMQNDLNKSSSEVIATYVYDIGLVGGQFSFSSAVGVFNSIINLILLVSMNAVARKVSETSLW